MNIYIQLTFTSLLYISFYHTNENENFLAKIELAVNTYSFCSRLVFDSLLFFSFLVYLLQPQKAKDLISIVGDSKAFNNYVLSDSAAGFTELMAFEWHVLIALSFGQLLAIITTLVISVKKKWFWINPLIVISLLFVLFRYEHEQTLRYTILSFGRMFQYPILYLLVIGVLMHSLALFFFFYKPFNQFVSKSQLTNYPQTKAIETT